MAKKKSTSSTEPVRLGIVGIGRAGWGMQTQELAGRKKTFQIVAGCDVLGDRRQMLAEATGCATYARIEDLLDDPDVEMVSIATRSCDHYDHARAALKAGKHVLVEKPMTATYDEARKLRRAARTSKGQLFVRHNRRYEPAFNHIREILASGKIGAVHEIKLRRTSYQRRDDWQTLKRYGGGQLLNWGPHIVDHALRLLEAPVKTTWSDLKRVAAVGDAEDHLKIVLVGRNGRVVDLEISGAAAVGQPEYTIWGDRGGLTCAGDTIHLKYIDPRKKLSERRPQSGTPPFGGFGSAEQLPWIQKELPVKPSPKVDMTMIWDDLFAAVRLGEPFRVTLDQSVEVMKVISAAKEGTRFAPPKARKSNKTRASR